MLAYDFRYDDSYKAERDILMLWKHTNRLIFHQVYIYPIWVSSCLRTENALVNIRILFKAPQEESMLSTCMHEASALRLTRKWEPAQILGNSRTSWNTQKLETFDKARGINWVGRNVSSTKFEVRFIQPGYFWHQMTWDCKYRAGRK